jgi:regulator of RNase E activity RraA
MIIERIERPHVTVKTLASDIAAAFKAIDLCEPGDVVVIDSHGSVNTAF